MMFFPCFSFTAPLHHTSLTFFILSVATATTATTNFAAEESVTKTKEVWLLQKIFTHMMNMTLWRLEADMPKCGAALSITHPDGTAHKLTIQTLRTPEDEVVGADVQIEFQECVKKNNTSYAQNLSRRCKSRISSSVMGNLLGNAMAAVQASIENTFKVCIRIYVGWV